MSEEAGGKQGKNGFRRAGAWLLGFAWLGLVFAGMAIAFTPSPHSPALGWGLLGIAALVLVFTMDRWVKVFPGLLTLWGCGQHTHADERTRGEPPGSPCIQT